MYSTLYHPCIVWCMEHMYTLCCMHWFIYLFYLFWGERVVKCFFFSSNIDMILIVFIIYVILFLWLRLLYHDKSLPFSFCGEGKIYCDSLIWVKEIKIKHFREMFWCKRNLFVFLYCLISCHLCVLHIQYIHT